MYVEKSEYEARTWTHASPLYTLQLLLQQLRPKQWTKNLLVFAAYLFSIKTIPFWMTGNVIAAFILFCFVSGSVYILNDFVDREADRLHPEKKRRPMASGELNPYLALWFGALLLFASIVFAFYLNTWFGVLLLLYFVINAAYSLRLKHVVIMDAMLIAAGFVLRSIGGGAVIGVPLTSWFIMCTMLLALFLAFSKRRHELNLLQENKGAHRQVLDSYSVQLLDQIIVIVTTATIMCYSLFTYYSVHSNYLMWTIPLVLYGVFRYLYLIYVKDEGGRPEKLLLQDRHILITVFLYAVTVIFLLLNFD